MATIRTTLGRACAAAALAAVLGGACSSDDADDDAATAEDDAADGDAAGTSEEASGAPGESLCSLVPEDRVEAILGVAVQVAVDTADECTYDEERTDEALAVLTVATEDGGEEQFRFDSENLIAGSEHEELTGLGDAAFYDVGFDLLRVLVDGQIYNVSITDPDVADKQAAAVAVTEELLGNL